MINKINSMLDSERGKQLYLRAVSCIKEYGMQYQIKNGVLVGFSGGADSVILLCVLKKYCEENHCLAPVAVHVNHMIRGEEADYDEAFSRDFCFQIGIEFLSFKLDVPSYAREHGMGMEEAARKMRYSCFEDIISGRNDVSCVSVAHNATDNVETVMFNIMRGCGTRGAAGIPPVRDNILRPLINVAKSDIVEILSDYGIPYVTDSTNLSSDYTRNYIRNEILPRLKRVSDFPETSINRLSENLRMDDDFITDTAIDFLNKNKNSDGSVSVDAMRSLHPALLSRVVNIMAKSVNHGVGCEQVHIKKIRELLFGTDFSISLPGDVSFYLRGAYCYVSKEEHDNSFAYKYKLLFGVNTFPEFDSAIIISKTKLPQIVSDSYSKVYKISIQQAVDFDIINGELYVRSKEDGDTYKHGGITRKLKKIFNDKKIPRYLRHLVPIICDDSGILWVPGLGLRDSDKKSVSDEKIFVAVAEPLHKSFERSEFFLIK